MKGVRPGAQRRARSFHPHAEVDTRAVRATADALMEFYNIRQLDHDPSSELGELILEMHGALRIVEHRRR